jgi:CubicO group peptidase (beta-lactamase class C family)
MKKFIISLLALAIISANAQQRAPLREPQSVYKNLEEASSKITVKPSTNPKTIVSKEPDNKIALQAANHIGEPEIVALLLVEDGKLIFEGYSKGSTAKDKFASLSMAKSIVSLAVGEALCSGKIKNLDDRADTYAKELENLPIGKTSIRNLLRMNSGIKTNTMFHGQPFASAGTDLLLRKTNHLDVIKRYASEVNAPIKFNYSNMDTDALNYVIRGSTGSPLSEWVRATVTEKAGFESSSSWAIDNLGVEISSSFFFATALDWARLALHIEKLLINDQDTCMRDYLKSATTKQIDASTSEFNDYGYQFFIHPKSGPKSSYWMVGFGGQRIAFIPEKRRIMINFAWSHDTSKTYTFFNSWN